MACNNLAASLVLDAKTTHFLIDPTIGTDSLVECTSYHDLTITLIESDSQHAFQPGTPELQVWVANHNPDQPHFQTVDPLVWLDEVLNTAMGCDIRQDCTTTEHRNDIAVRAGVQRSMEHAEAQAWNHDQH